MVVGGVHSMHVLWKMHGLSRSKISTTVSNSAGASLQHCHVFEDALAAAMIGVRSHPYGRKPRRVLDGFEKSRPSQVE